MGTPSRTAPCHRGAKQHVGSDSKLIDSDSKLIDSATRRT